MTHTLVIKVSDSPAVAAATNGPAATSKSPRVRRELDMFECCRTEIRNGFEHSGVSKQTDQVRRSTNSSGFGYTSQHRLLASHQSADISLGGGDPCLRIAYLVSWATLSTLCSVSFTGAEVPVFTKV